MTLRVYQSGSLARRHWRSPSFPSSIDAVRPKLSGRRGCHAVASLSLFVFHEVKCRRGARRDGLRNAFLRILLLGDGVPSKRLRFVYQFPSHRSGICRTPDRRVRAVHSLTLHVFPISTTAHQNNCGIAYRILSAIILLKQQFRLTAQVFLRPFLSTTVSSRQCPGYEKNKCVREE